jgi:hypothetical protein
MCKKLHGHRSSLHNNSYIPPVNLTKINQLGHPQLGQNERLLHSNERKTVQNTNVNYITQTSQYILPHTSNDKELIQRLLTQPNSILLPNQNRNQNHNQNHNQNQHNTQTHLNQRFNGVTIHDYKRNNSSIDSVHHDNYFSKNRGEWNQTPEIKKAALMTRRLSRIKEYNFPPQLRKSIQRHEMQTMKIAFVISNLSII